MVTARTKAAFDAAAQKLIHALNKPLVGPEGPALRPYIIELANAAAEILPPRDSPESLPPVVYYDGRHENTGQEAIQYGHPLSLWHDRVTVPLRRIQFGGGQQLVDPESATRLDDPQRQSLLSVLANWRHFVGGMLEHPDVDEVARLVKSARWQFTAEPGAEHLLPPVEYAVRPRLPDLTADAVSVIGREHGRLAVEVMWERKPWEGGLLLVPKRLKPFHESESIAKIVLDDPGDFKHLRYYEQKILPAYCLLVVFRPQLHPLFGTPHTKPGETPSAVASDLLEAVAKGGNEVVNQIIRDRWGGQWMGQVRVQAELPVPPPSAAAPPNGHHENTLPSPQAPAKDTAGDGGEDKHHPGEPLTMPPSGTPPVGKPPPDAAPMTQREAGEGDGDMPRPGVALAVPVNPLHRNAAEQAWEVPWYGTTPAAKPGATDATPQQGECLQAGNAESDEERSGSLPPPAGKSDPEPAHRFELLGGLWFIRFNGGKTLRFEDRYTGLGIIARVMQSPGQMLRPIMLEGSATAAGSQQDKESFSADVQDEDEGARRSWGGDDGTENTKQAVGEMLRRLSVLKAEAESLKNDLSEYAENNEMDTAEAMRDAAALKAKDREKDVINQHLNGRLVKKDHTQEKQARDRVLRNIKTAREAIRNR